MARLEPSEAFLEELEEELVAAARFRASRRRPRPPAAAAAQTAGARRASRVDRRGGARARRGRRRAGAGRQRRRAAAAAGGPVGPHGAARPDALAGPLLRTRRRAARRELPRSRTSACSTSGRASTTSSATSDTICRSRRSTRPRRGSLRTAGAGRGCTWCHRSQCRTTRVAPPTTGRACAWSRPRAAVPVLRDRGGARRAGVRAQRSRLDRRHRPRRDRPRHAQRRRAARERTRVRQRLRGGARRAVRRACERRARAVRRERLRARGRPWAAGPRRGAAPGAGRAPAPPGSAGAVARRGPRRRGRRARRSPLERRRRRRALGRPGVVPGGRADCAPANRVCVVAVPEGADSDAHCALDHANREGWTVAPLYAGNAVVLGTVPDRVTGARVTVGGRSAMVDAELGVLAGVLPFPHDDFAETQIAYTYETNRGKPDRRAGSHARAGAPDGCADRRPRGAWPAERSSCLHALGVR